MAARLRPTLLVGFGRRVHRQARGGGRGLRAAARFAPAVGVLLACAVLLAGCGRKTAVVSPELAAPEPVLDLQAVSFAEGIRLSWSRPRRRVGGEDLESLAGFHVLRDNSGVGPGGWELVGTVPVTDRERFLKARKFSY